MGEFASSETLAAQLDLHPMARGLLLSSLAHMVTRWVVSKLFVECNWYYQAPELLKGKVPSRACDVYSLGILLWQLDSRSVPYPGQHPQVKTIHNIFLLYIFFQVVMFQVVSMVARPKPPPSSTAAVGLPVFTSLYSSCWAATPCERWIYDF